MRVEGQEKEGQYHLKVEGSLDAEGSTVLRDWVLRGLGSGLTRQVIDLAATDRVDGPALSVLVTLLFKLQDAGGDLRVKGVAGTVEAAFINTGLARVFQLGASPS